MKITIYILLLVFYVIVNNCEAEEKCRFSKCNKCISSTDDCMWCSQRNMTNEQTTRCMPKSHLNVSSTWCAKEYIEQSIPITEASNITAFDKTIQLQPRSIKIKARPGYESKFKFYYKPAKDYPLDVYFLIDISYTMKSKLHALKGQADEIYTQLTQYSNNVRLGIGSFVEKPGFPYVDKNKTEPHRAHAFKHHLSLTNNTENFKTTIDNIQFGANYDDPEAALDGLMQAMTCLDELGWRNNTRRIIVLCTDSTYHSAGDGKIVGAIKPNDMKCHLKNNVYDETLALTYDYPSISQINKKSIEGQFTIVFAAVSAASEVYKKLATQISGAKYATLERGTEAVEIIKEAYRINAIEPSLTFIEQWPNFLEMTYDCGMKKCESTPENRTVEMNGKLTIKQCPTDDNFNGEYSFGIRGIPDKLTFELDIDCKCDCEKTSGEPDSICQNGGLLQCGICNCNNTASYGINCQCNSTDTDTKHDDNCKLTGKDNKFCSGNGICECGKCVTCTKGYSGDYCEYNNDACPKKDGKLCSGKGKCDRGKCECNTYWTGADCSCSLNSNACMAPYSKNVCSGNGICTCGKCECAANGTYSGTYCDVCDDCAEKRCKELENYVHCNVVNETKLCDKLYNTKDTTVVTFKNETELNELEWNMAQLCEIHFENDSKIIFKYQYNDAKLVLGIQKGLVSPPEVNLFVAVGSAIGAVLLIGILTLIAWKILIDLHDKREYEKFSQESKAAGYDVTFNPLFIEAEVSFPNPTFERTD